MKYEKQFLDTLNLPQLMILFPDNYYLYKDCGTWNIFNDNDIPVMDNSDYDPTGLVKEFLLTLEPDELMLARVGLYEKLTN